MNLTWHDLMEMPLGDILAWNERLAERRKEEADAMEKAARKGRG